MEVQNSETSVAPEAAGMGFGRAEPCRGQGRGSADATHIGYILTGTAERALAQHVSGPNEHFEKARSQLFLRKNLCYRHFTGRVTEALRR